MKRYIPYVILLCVIVIGAYLRLHDISLYMTFLGDEGRDALVVKRMIVDGKWTLLGPTASVGGFFMGPIYYYFMAPFLWLWNFNPVGPAIMVALFGIATIGLVCFYGTKIGSIQTGLVASALYALSPIVIVYSRSSWNPNIVPFFALSLMYCMWYATVKQRWNVLFLAGIISGIGLQLHYTFLFLLVVVLIWVLIYGRSWKNKGAYGLFIVGFLLGFAPFLGFEVRHEFANTRSIIQYIFSGKDTGYAGIQFFHNISYVFFKAFGRLLLRYPDGLQYAELQSWQKLVWNFSSWIVGILSVLVAAGIAFRIAIVKRLCRWFSLDPTHEQIVAARLFLFWFGIVLCMFGLYRKSIYDYYFGIIFPLPFLLYGLWWLYVRKRRVLIIIYSVLTIGLIILNWEGRPFRYQPNNQLGQVALIAKEVVAHADGKPFNFALISGGNSDHAYRYFMELWGITPVTIENEQNDPERKTVTDQLLVVCEDTMCQPLGNSLWEVAGFGRAEIAGQWDVSVVKLYKLIHYTGT